MQSVSFVSTFVFFIGDGFRVQQSVEQIREGEESHEPSGFSQMDYSLVELNRSQVDKAKVSYSPWRVVVPLLAAGHVSAGLQFGRDSDRSTARHRKGAGISETLRFGGPPPGRPLGIEKEMGSVNQFGNPSRHVFHKSRRPILTAMQHSSDDEHLPQLDSELGDESSAIHSTGANTQNESNNIQPGLPVAVHEQLEFDKVVERLKLDASQIFRTEPNWDIFAADFKLIESTGDVVQGLGPLKMILGTLRKMRNRFEIKDDIDVQFDSGERVLSGPLNKTILQARWKVKLGLELPLLEYASNPLLAYAIAPGDSVIEAVSTIHFNTDNKVDFIQIDKWVVTGDLLKSWPEVKLSDDRTEFIKKVRDWATDLKEMNEALPAGAGSEAAETLVKASANLAATFIASEIEYIATAAASSGLLAGAADAISYGIDGIPVNGSHVGAMALSAGVFSGIFNAIWLQELERKIPGTDFAAVLTKTVADFVIAGTFFSTWRLLCVPVLAAAFGGLPLAPDHLLDGLTLDKFVETRKLSLVTFTPYNLFAFRLIPLNLQPLAAAAVSALNTIIFSEIMRQSGIDR